MYYILTPVYLVGVAIALAGIYGQTLNPVLGLELTNLQYGMIATAASIFCSYLWIARLEDAMEDGKEGAIFAYACICSVFVALIVGLIHSPLLIVGVLSVFMLDFNLDLFLRTVPMLLLISTMLICLKLRY